VFLIATLGLRFYLRWITSTGYTYGALSTPIAFLLFAFFGGFAIMLGAELNASIQEEFPAPRTHAHRLRNWVLTRRSGRRRTAELTAAPPDVATAEPPA
jgi:membrane protein